VPPAAGLPETWRVRAAAWIAGQVSSDAIVACDPAMCAALAGRAVAADNLLLLRPAAPDPLGSDVVVATAGVRSQFGGRLASVYAPEVLARFGSGRDRIDVRIVAPDGAAAYRAALASDLAARRHAGAQLLRNPLLTASPVARGELLAGRVDPRLLITLAAVADAGPVHITAFTDAGPGADAGLPLRAAELTAAASGAAGLRGVLAFLRAQRPPYLPATAGIAPGAGGSSVLTVEFPAPSPLGLLQTQPPHLTGRHPVSAR
jgi:hypothetical protein